MNAAVIFDCEFLTSEGAQRRFWCGPDDPDPYVVQIGAVRLSLDAPHDIDDTLRLFIRPKDRQDRNLTIDPFFTKLTGIAKETVAREGVALASAIAALDDFSQGAQIWSWGKDEFNLMAISCYVEGIEPSIPISRFSNACHLLLQGGMPLEDLQRTRSSGLADYFAVEHPPMRGHDALDDALSVAYALQHLLRTEKLTTQDFLAADRADR